MIHKLCMINIIYFIPLFVHFWPEINDLCSFFAKVGYHS